MRFLMTCILPFVIWLGLLQGPLEPHPPDSLGGILSVAAALTGLTVAVYRLGVWREQMNSTKSNVTAELARFREDSDRHFVTVERRLFSIEQRITGVIDERAALERWQGRVDTTLETHGRRLDALSSPSSPQEAAA
jgi:hypothetical protein